MRKKVRLGYYIGHNVYADIARKCLICFNSGKACRKVHVVYLRDTMMRLLTYIMDNALDTIITDEDIMFNVWDMHGLSSSSQRLWSVMNGLEKKLHAIGISNDFITRVKSQGYYIRSENCVTIYCERYCERKKKH